MKVVTVVGARPQFIKAAAVSRRLAETPGAEECLVHTGQHFDENMSDIFFSEMQIPAPHHKLGISGGSHGQMTARMLAELETVLQSERPDCLLVYGDTNSTLAGALAAAKLGIPIAHVEAGLRSFNRAMPEEINRVLTDHVAELLYAPTQLAMDNLAREGIADRNCLLVGDVMYDAALFFGAHAVPTDPRIAELSMAPFVLATVHRQENTDDPERLRNIFEALSDVATTLPVLLPLHPRTRKTLEAAGASDLLAPLSIVEPLGYFDMLAAEAGAAVIATDSGGVQKEAFFSGTPCVTLRSETEWTELVDAGWNQVVPPTDRATIASAILGAIGTTGRDVTPYGDGDAAGRIVSGMLQRFGG